MVASDEVRPSTSWKIAERGEIVAGIGVVIGEDSNSDGQ